MNQTRLVYFFGFLIILLIYCLYKSEEESRRLYNIAEDLKFTAEEQNRLINTQRLYIEYLNRQDLSPIHRSF
jgi:hypothetical protein